MLEDFHIKTPSKDIIDTRLESPKMDDSICKSCQSIESVRRRKSSLMSSDFDLLAEMELPSEISVINEISFTHDLQSGLDRAILDPSLKDVQKGKTLFQLENVIKDLESPFDIQCPLDPVDEEIMNLIDKSFAQEMGPKKMT